MMYVWQMILTPSAIKVFLPVMVVIIAVVVRGLVEEVVVGVGGYVVYMTSSIPNTANHNGMQTCKQRKKCLCFTFSINYPNSFLGSILTLTLPFQLWPLLGTLIYKQQKSCFLIGKNKFLVVLCYRYLTRRYSHLTRAHTTIWLAPILNFWLILTHTNIWLALFSLFPYKSPTY